ncbi:MAG: transcriptional regulator NrdR [Acidimicrobiia bacterium]
MRCPFCHASDDKVVDSRTAEEGAAIRRRRECLACGRRYTTYERIEELPFLVRKRSGEIEPFDRAKVARGIERAVTNRPIDGTTVELVAAQIEEELRELGAEVSSEAVGLAVLEHLRVLDEVAYLRYASVYKGFENVGDFAREVGLLRKTTEPKRKPRNTGS